MRAGLVILCVWTLTTACGDASPGPPAAAPPKKGAPADQAAGLVIIPPDSAQLQQVRVQSVDAASVPTEEVLAPARVAVNPNRVSRVVPQVQGRVVRVMAKFGDFVERGQPVVELESPDADAAVSTYLQSQATERQARATLVKAEADLARTGDLYQYKAVAEKDLLAARNDFAQAKAGLEAAEAARQQAGRKLELLGLKPTDFHQPVFVRAPLSGKVLEVNVAPGEYRAAVSFHTDVTAPLMTIADLSTVWVSADVPESSIRLIQLGQPVEITLIAYPGEVFRGRVARIADVLDPQTRTVKFYVELPNVQGRLRPEMFASVRVVGATRSAPVLPPSAVIHTQGRTVVFVEQGPGRFERREVVLGPRVGDVVVVVKGLRAGERVVVGGTMLLLGQ